MKAVRERSKMGYEKRGNGVMDTSHAKQGKEKK